MSDEQNSTRRSSGGFQLPPWMVIVLFAAIVAISYWSNSGQETRRPHQSSHERDPEVAHPDHFPGKSTSEPRLKEQDSDPQSEAPNEAVYAIQHQTIRDLNGNVVFEGTVNIKPTLDRIKRGGSNRHRNDGTVFENREGRIPRKSRGYYKEYVHPTPGEHGPGPQRIIIGQDGEIWYTPDHYRSFVEVK